MTNKRRVTWGYAARQGALTGAVLAYAYSLLFLVYALVRESSVVLGTPNMGDSGLLLLSNGVSLAVVVLVLGTVMALLSALIGAITEVVLLLVLRRLITADEYMAAVLTGLGASLVIAFLIHVVTGIVPGTRLNLTYPATYLFWLGVPTVIYVIAGALRGGEINARTFRAV